MSEQKNRVSKTAGWKELPFGGIIPQGGTAEDFHTGDWRTKRPIWDEAKCIHCLRCVAYCPDMSVLIAGDKMQGFDYDHCKGCGICANVCPVKGKAIHLVNESEAAEQDGKKGDASK